MKMNIQKENIERKGDKEREKQIIKMSKGEKIGK